MEKRIHFRKTLYFRMLVVTILMGITFFAGIYYIYKVSCKRFEEELRYHSDTLTAQICQNVDTSLNELAEKTIPLTITNERLGPLLAAGGTIQGLRIRKHLEELLSMNYDVLWMSVVDQNQNVYLASRDSRLKTLIPDSSRLNGLYQENMEKLTDRPGNIVWLASDNKDGILFMRLIFDADTMQFCGGIIAELENRTLKDIFAGVDSSKAGDFILYDRDGRPIYTTDELFVGTTKAFDEKHYLYHEYPINRGKLRIAHIVDLKAKNQRFADLLNLILVIGLVLFALILVFLWLMFGKTAKNLKILLGNIDRISAGDFELEPTLFEKGDELDTLALSIQQMSGRIKRLMEQVVREEEIRQQSEYKLLEARYQELQAQVNPHFLFNILQSINGVAQLEGDMQVSRLICMLSKFFRGSIDRRHTSCELKEELEYVRNYMELYQRIYPDRLTIEWEIDERCLKERIPTHILQPIIENSLVHGMEPMVEACTVRVSVLGEEERLYIRVWDNGMGIPAGKLSGILADSDKTRRIGIRNVQDRIQLLYGSEFGLEIRSEYQQYTEVTVVLPRKL